MSKICLMNDESMIVLYDERCADYVSPGHPERPDRVTKTARRLKKQSRLSIEWRLPVAASEEAIRLAHSAVHIKNLRESNHDFDGDTPWYEDIEKHALRAAGAALDAMESARNGRHALSLMRPPGHHATRERAMGFCYLGSMAIAILNGMKSYGLRMAVLDFDVHHGNGTEDILHGNENVLFASIHQSPCYPGTGLRHRPPNCRNYPQKPYTPRFEYRKGFALALEDIKAFEPDLLGVSAGFDAFADDTIAQELLEKEDFEWIGKQISGSGIPAFSVLEGGYSDALAELVEAYMCGLAGSLIP